MKASLLVLVFAVALATVRGDTWEAAALKIVTSIDGSALLRITPGDGNKLAATAILMRFDSKTGDYRKVSQFPLKNRIAPCDTLITDNAEFIVTFDDWASIGRSENVVVLYRGTGELVRAWSLQDLFSEPEIQTFTRTSSSTWWRGDVVVIEGSGPDPRIQILTARGMVSGKPLYPGRNPDFPFYLNLGSLKFTK
ncbi:hypothetical protein [Horticoccus sp. 23ND18S-11]